MSKFLTPSLFPSERQSSSLVSSGKRRNKKRRKSVTFVEDGIWQDFKNNHLELIHNFLKSDNHVGLNQNAFPEGMKSAALIYVLIDTNGHSAGVAIFHTFLFLLKPFRINWSTTIEKFFPSLTDLKMRPTNTLFLTTLFWNNQFDPNLFKVLLEKIMLENYYVQYIVLAAQNNSFKGYGLEKLIDSFFKKYEADKKNDHIDLLYLITRDTVLEKISIDVAKIEDLNNIRNLFLNVEPSNTKIFDDKILSRIIQNNDIISPNCIVSMKRSKEIIGAFLLTTNISKNSKKDFHDLTEHVLGKNFKSGLIIEFIGWEKGVDFNLLREFFVGVFQLFSNKSFLIVSCCGSLNIFWSKLIEHFIKVESPNLESRDVFILDKCSLISGREVHVEKQTSTKLIRNSLNIVDDENNSGKTCTQTTFTISCDNEVVGTCILCAMANVNEIRQYFHCEEQLHPYDYENKEQSKTQSEQGQGQLDKEKDDCQQRSTERKTQTQFQQYCQHPVADSPDCCSCSIKYFSMKNTFRGLLKLFFWEISRLSQYTHFYYRLDSDTKLVHGKQENVVAEAANKNDKASDDGKNYNYNQRDYNSLLQHFVFIPKRRSKCLTPFILDYDLYYYSLRMAQSHTTRSVNQCNTRIVVLGTGATLLYFLNYLVLRINYEIKPDLVNFNNLFIIVKEKRDLIWKNVQKFDVKCARPPEVVNFGARFTIIEGEIEKIERSERILTFLAAEDNEKKKIKYDFLFITMPLQFAVPKNLMTIKVSPSMSNSTLGRLLKPKTSEYYRPRNFEFINSTSDYHDAMDNLNDINYGTGGGKIIIYGNNMTSLNILKHVIDNNNLRIPIVFLKMKGNDGKIEKKNEKLLGSTSQGEDAKLTYPTNISATTPASNATAATDDCRHTEDKWKRTTALDDEEDILFNCIIGRLVSQIKAPLTTTASCSDVIQFEYYCNYKLVDIKHGQNKIVTDLIFQHEDNLEDNTKNLIVRCKMFFCCTRKTVDCQLMKALVHSGIVFDGKIVIDEYFRTSDKNVYAFGDCTKYKAILKADQLQHENFNCEEIAEYVAQSLKASCTGNVQTLIHQRNTVPIFKIPTCLKSNLPTNCHYFSMTNTNLDHLTKVATVASVKPASKSLLVTCNLFSYSQTNKILCWAIGCVDVKILQGRNILIIDSVEFLEWNDDDNKFRSSGLPKQLHKHFWQLESLPRQTQNKFCYLHFHINLHGQIDGAYCMTEQEESHIQNLINLYGNYVSVFKDIEVNFPQICKTILFSEPSWVSVVVDDKFNKWNKALYDKMVCCLNARNQPKVMENHVTAAVCSLMQSL